VDPALIEVLASRLSLVIAPTVILMAFGAIRWDLRKIGAWSSRTIQILTLSMWGLICADFFIVLIPLRVLAAVVPGFALAVFLLREPIVERLSRRYLARRRAAESVDGVFELAVSPFGPFDEEQLKQDLAALDQWVTPDTFEFIQLARARVLHWLDGGSNDAPNATRWRNRMNAIAAEWWPPAKGSAVRDRRQTLRRTALRWSTGLAVIGGVVLGASSWVAPGPPELAAAVVVSWLVVWADRRTVISASIVGAIGGLLGATAFQIESCRSCDWSSTVVSVAATSLVGLLLALYFVVSRPKPKPGSDLRLVATSTPPRKGEEREQ
jgi:hypothetical protein